MDQDNLLNLNIVPDSDADSIQLIPSVPGQFRRCFCFALKSQDSSHKNLFQDIDDKGVDDGAPHKQENKEQSNFV